MMAIVLCGDDCVGIVGNAGGRAGKKTPAVAPHKVSRGTWRVEYNYSTIARFPLHFST